MFDDKSMELDDLSLEPVAEPDEVVQEAGAMDAFADGQNETMQAVKPSTQSASRAVAPKQQAVQARTSDDLFDFSGLENVPGIVVGDVGLTVSRFPVERTRFTKASRSMISFVTNKVIAIKMHYHEDIGSFVCYSGKCCEIGGLAKVRYLFPVVVYETDKKGAPISTNIENRVLSVGKDTYEDIMTMGELNGGLTTNDVLVTCSDEQYQKISLQPAGSVRWRKSKALVAKVTEFWKAHMKDIVTPVARTLNDAEINKILSGAIGGAQPASENVDFDDVFK